MSVNTHGVVSIVARDGRRCELAPHDYEVIEWHDPRSMHSEAEIRERLKRYEHAKIAALSIPEMSAWVARIAELRWVLREDKP